jgi:hypothetical protein
LVKEISDKYGTYREMRRAMGIQLTHKIYLGVVSALFLERDAIYKSVGKHLRQSHIVSFTCNESFSFV